MNFRTMTATTLTGVCCLVFAVTPDLCAGADSTTSATVAAQPAEPGTIRNNFITYKEEPNACFNHEASGGNFTLATPERGAIAQLFYSVTYDGKTAAYRHEADQAPYPDGFDSKTTQSIDGKSIKTEVRSSDGAIVVRTESAVGKGPYVTRQMKVTNTGKKALNKVQLLLTVNADTSDWENEVGAVNAEAGQALIRNSEKTEWVGIGAQPKPAYLTAGDVMELLGEEAGTDWSQPSTSYTGNTAVQIGWEVGPLAPGESKTVEATFAMTSSENDVKKALSRQAFDEKK